MTLIQFIRRKWASLIVLKNMLRLKGHYKYKIWLRVQYQDQSSQLLIVMIAPCFSLCDYLIILSKRVFKKQGFKNFLDLILIQTVLHQNPNIINLSKSSLSILLLFFDTNLSYFDDFSTDFHVNDQQYLFRLVMLVQIQLLIREKFQKYISIKEQKTKGLRIIVIIQCPQTPIIMYQNLPFPEFFFQNGNAWKQTTCCVIFFSISVHSQKRICLSSHTDTHTAQFQAVSRLEFYNICNIQSSQSPEVKYWKMHSLMVRLFYLWCISLILYFWYIIFLLFVLYLNNTLYLLFFFNFSWSFFQIKHHLAHLFEFAHGKASSFFVLLQNQPRSGQLDVQLPYGPRNRKTLVKDHFDQNLSFLRQIQATLSEIREYGRLES